MLQILVFQEAVLGDGLVLPEVEPRRISLLTKGRFRKFQEGLRYIPWNS